MKTTIFLAALLTGFTAQAEISKTRAVDCAYNVEEYAKNDFPNLAIARYPIDLKEQSVTSLRGQLEDREIEVRPGYVLEIGGYISKPSSRWTKGESELVIHASLIRKVGERVEVLQDTYASSDELSSLKAYEAYLGGARVASVRLNNLKYATLNRNGKTKPAKDLLTSVYVSCELVKLP